MTTVLCIDPDDTARSTAAETLGTRDGLGTIEGRTVTDAREALESEEIDCVVTETEFPDGSGLEVVDHVREHVPDVPCIVFTETQPGDLDTTGFQGLIVEYLRKSAPSAHDRLGDLVGDVVDHRAQVSYPVPQDEDARIEALREYQVDEMDDVADSFDRLTDLVASHFDVPVAFVGLVDEHEEDFLACTGGDFDTLTREDTICTHCILEEQVMVVEDITEDRRFSGNDTLLSLGIQSYAGANLDTPDGRTIGSLCLIDYEPRSYTDAEKADLIGFANEAMEQLELRRRLLEGDE